MKLREMQRLNNGKKDKCNIYRYGMYCPHELYKSD